MEVAVTAVLGAGIRAVLARSFSRTYYRNAVNNGLLPVICETGGIVEGDRIDVVLAEGVTVRNESRGRVIRAGALPPIMMEIISAGGLVPYFRQHGGFSL